MNQTGERTTCAPGALSSAPSAKGSDDIRKYGAKGDPTMGSIGRMPSRMLAGSKMSTGGEEGSRPRPFGKGKLLFSFFLSVNGSKRRRHGECYRSLNSQTCLGGFEGTWIRKSTERTCV